MSTIRHEKEQKYFLWALPKGQTDRFYERPLTSVSLTPAQVEKVKDAASRDGWHDFRTVIDIDELPDFKKGLSRLVRRF